MSHNIEKADAGAGASVFTIRKSNEEEYGKPRPWHDLGTIFDSNPSVSEALDAMNSNYEVIKTPVEYKGQVVDKQFFTVRSDTDQVLGIVGDRYQVIQTIDGFKILDVIGGDVYLEAGGVLGCGEKVFLCCKLPETTKVAGDTYDHYFVLINSHDGSSSLILVITPIRTVCQNTCNLALEKAMRRFNLRHTANYENRLQEAARALGIVKNYYTKFKDVVEELVKMKYTDDQFFKLMDQLNPEPADDASQRMKSFHEKTRQGMIDCYYAEDLENIRETKLGAYQAVVAYSDHSRGNRGKDDARRAANRFIRTFDDVDLKDKAYALLTATS